MFKIDGPLIVRNISYALDKIIYEWIGYIYDFLIDLAKMKIFAEEDFSNLTKNLYMVIGIIILFKVAFILIQIMSNPENAFIKKEDGTAQFLVPRLSITLALLIMAPAIFSELYEFQRIVLENNVIPRILTVVVGDNNQNKTVEIGNERCVLTFDGLKFPSFRHECDDAYVVPDPSKVGQYLCTAEGSPFKGIISKQIENDGLISSGPLYQPSNIAPGAHFVVDLSDDRSYFINGNPIKYADISNMSSTYSSSLLTTNEVQVGRSTWNSNGSYSCKDYATMELTQLSPSRFYYEIMFFDEKPTLSNDPNKAILIRQREYSGMVSAKKYVITSGRTFASNLLFSFAQKTDNMNDDDEKIYDQAKVDANYDSLYTLITKKQGDNFIIKYAHIISTVFGGIVLLLLASSCFDIAMRAVGLAFLQIIAPIPIATFVEYGNTSGKTFNNYVKSVMGLYADLFIRVLAISFATYMIDLAMKMERIRFYANNQYLLEKSDSYRWLLELFIILGALMFIKKVPSMIAEIFGIRTSAGNMFELNPLKKLQEIPVAGTAVGMGMGAVGGIAGGMIAAGTMGMGAGASLLNAGKSMGAGALRGATNVPLGGAAFDNRKGFMGNLKQSFSPFEGGTRVGGNITRQEMYRRHMDTEGAARSGIDQYSSRIDATQANIDRIDSRIQEVASRHDVVSGQMNTLVNQYNNLNQQLVANNNLSSADISQIRVQMADVDSKIKMADAERVVYNQQLTTLQAEQNTQINQLQLDKDALKDLKIQIGDVKGKEKGLGLQTEQEKKIEALLKKHDPDRK